MKNNDYKSRVPVSRRIVRWLVILVVLALVGAGGWFAWKKWGAPPKGDEYIFAAIQRGDIEDLVSATGALQPRDFVDVGAQVSGQVKKIHVEVGTDVREGDLLAEIDAEQLNARVDASRAQLRARQADLVVQEVNLSKATRDLQRQKNLLAEEATTLELVQNAETTLASTRAAIGSTRAGIEQLQASMRVDETNLNYTRIYAPMSGTVASITAKQGQTLNANQSAPIVLRIADLSVMTVQTQVSEADVSRLRADMPAYFTTLGSQGRRWWGRLKKVEPTPTVTNNVVLYNALFEVPNANRALMTQMTAQVFFIVQEARDVLVAPMSALTIARTGPPGGGQRGERDAQPPAGAASGAASGPPSGSAAGAGAPSRPASAGASARRAAAIATTDAPREASREAPREGSRDSSRDSAREAARDAGASTSGAERPRMNREAWAQMSDEDRQRMRAERMAQRGASEGAPRAPAGATNTAVSGDAPARASSAPTSASPAIATQSPPRARPAQRSNAGTGMAVQPAPAIRPPRKATVKVETAAGNIEEREVTIGVSNRVHAQVLSGLAEGDRVLAGVKVTEAAQRRAGNPQAGQGPQGPGGVPGGVGGMGGAGAGGRR